jgi:hypothetical protein
MLAGAIVDLSPELTVPAALNAEAFARFLTDKCDAVNLAFLQEALAARDLLVVWSPFWTDLLDKIRMFRELPNSTVLWLGGTILPRYEPSRAAHVANLVDTFNYLRRRKQSNVVLLISHGVNYVNADLVRRLLPEIKLVSYIYDWLGHGVPRQHAKDLAHKFGMTPRLIEQNYTIAERILAGEIVDGILHKDGGQDFALYADCPLPRLFFPIYLSRNLFQKPPCSGEAARRVVHIIGSLPHPEHCRGGLDARNDFSAIYASLVGQGMTVDVYYLAERTDPSVLEYYRRTVGPGLKLIPGRPLQNLLPELRGRYGWGFMITADDGGAVREHTAHTLPSKVFAYAALGIPLLVSPEFELIADLTRRHDIGLVLTGEDVQSLCQMMPEINHAHLCQNVVRFRESYALEDHQSEFQAFISSFIH